jgi:hypothetical protein
MPQFRKPEVYTQAQFSEAAQDEIDQLEAAVHYFKLKLATAVIEEREACAQLVEKFDLVAGGGAKAIAAAIRERI